MRTKRSYKKYVFYFFIVVMLSIFCINRLFLSSSEKSESFVSSLMYPLILIQDKVCDWINPYFEKDESVDKIKSELEKLKKENEELSSENIRIKSAIGYLENVEELIQFKKKYDKNYSKGIIAQLLMKQFSIQENYCFIDKGADDGVTKDMVAVYKDCIIGRISEVFPSYSKLAFVTDKSCKIAAYCCKTGTTGIYEGINQTDKASLSYVNHLATLEADDLVISSGEGVVFPQGFALGKISTFTSDGVQYKVSLNPIIDVNKLKYCYLIKK
jgi:rod shape-determining protein MreC